MVCDGSCWIGASQGTAFGYGVRLRFRLTFSEPGSISVMYDSPGTGALSSGGLGTTLAVDGTQTTLCATERWLIIGPCQYGEPLSAGAYFVELESAPDTPATVNVTVATGAYAGENGTVVLSDSKSLAQDSQGGEYLAINLGTGAHLDEVRIDRP